MYGLSCYFFFLLLLRHTPRSTLFPYTTLFRSRRIVLLDRAENTLYFVAVELHRAHPEIELLPVIANITNPERMAAVFRTDRKSIRLNSSHVKISYAVFCLKKKKTHQK